MIENNPAANAESSRQGAVTAPATAHEDAAVEEQGDDLPMVVWLRGDEPEVDDFTVDADGAMAFLGIKRSRLTQISGRELRVGRIRIDRYTRPVYRPSDLEAYRNWTRRTASHERSSKAIEQAALKLDEQTKKLESSVQETLIELFQRDLQQRLKSSWQGLLDHQRLLRRDLEALSRRGREADLRREKRWQAVLESTEARLAELSRELARVTTSIDALIEMTRDVATSQREVIIVTKTMRDDLHRQLPRLATDAALQGEIAALGQDLRDTFSLQNELNLRSLKERLTATEEATPGQRPRRAIPTAQRARLLRRYR